MESPMGIVKSECVHARACATREEAALDIFGYIEAVCNRPSLRRPIGRMTKAARWTGTI